MHFTKQIYTQKPPETIKLKPYFLLSILLLLTSCSTETPNQDPSKNITKVESASASTHTLTPELDRIFKESCAHCHLKDSSGAPKSGNKEAWDKILSKGMDATLERVMNGYGGMPPAGQCFECSPEQLIELIRFMSTQS